MDDEQNDFFIDDFDDFDNLDLEDLNMDPLVHTEDIQSYYEGKYKFSEEELILLIKTTVSETLEQMDIY